MNLEVTIGKMRMKNPVMTASGTFGYGLEYSEFVDLNALGAVVVKGLSLKPRDGNPPPRIYETPCGMLNSIGLQNVGVKTFLKEKLPLLRRYDVPVVVNVFGESKDEYVEISRVLDGKAEAIELNLSCPNVKKGGVLFSSDPGVFTDIVKRCRDVIRESTMVVKLSPQSDIITLSKEAERAGVDALSMINTIPAMAIDIETRKPALSTTTGGLSGPAIKPIGIRMVWEVYRSVKIPIIGMGGIMDHRDAIEYLIAGATAVAVGTANFVEPSATMKIIEGIKKYMQNKKITNIKEIIGALL